MSIKVTTDTKKLMAKILLFFLGVLFFLLPTAVKAIPPPEIIIGITQSLLGVMGLMAAFLVSGFYLFRDFLISIFLPKKKKQEQEKKQETLSKNTHNISL